MRDLFAGVDIGTSGCKLGLFDRYGETIVKVTMRYPTYTDGSGMAEQAPEEWWSAVCGGLRFLRLHVALPTDRIAAIGLCGQIGSQVLLDDGCAVLRRSMIWQDTRAAGSVDRFYEQFSEARLRDLLGATLPRGPNWPGPRLLWLRETEPDVFGRLRWVIQTKEYVGWRLTGALATDASSCRGLVSLISGEASAEIFAYLGLSPAVLPEIKEPWAELGRVNATASAETGIPVGVPVCVGWNDLNCALYGTGASVGMGFNITGTSDHVGVITGTPMEPGQILTEAPYMDTTRMLYGVTSYSGGSLTWALNLVPGARARREIDLDELVSAADGPSDLLFLPYLKGERAPVWDPHARGAFVGLSADHQFEDLVRAVMEGVAFSGRSIWEEVTRRTHLRPAVLLSAGGPTRSRVWNQLRADVLGMPYQVTREGASGCLGAGMLAVYTAT